MYIIKTNAPGIDLGLSIKFGLSIIMNTWPYPQ